MIKEVTCPHCGKQTEYDDNNDVVLCDHCDEMIFIDESEG